MLCKLEVAGCDPQLGVKQADLAAVTLIIALTTSQHLFRALFLY